MGAAVARVSCDSCGRSACSLTTVRDTRFAAALPDFRVVSLPPPARPECWWRAQGWVVRVQRRGILSIGQHGCKRLLRNSSRDWSLLFGCCPGNAGLRSDLGNYDRHGSGSTTPDCWLVAAQCAVPPRSGAGAFHLCPGSINRFRRKQYCQHHHQRITQFGTYSSARSPFPVSLTSPSTAI